VPYINDKLVSDFAELPLQVFGGGEASRLMDIRRTGSVEAKLETLR
jgi:hypothetical protein